MLCLCNGHDNRSVQANICSAIESFYMNAEKKKRTVYFTFFLMSKVVKKVRPGEKILPHSAQTVLRLY